MSGLKTVTSHYHSPCPLTPTHIQENPETLSAQKVAHKLNLYWLRKCSHSKPLPFTLTRTIELEAEFRRKRKLLCSRDFYELHGGISLATKYHDIPLRVQEKFNELRSRGILMNRSTFQETYDPNKFRTLGKIASPHQKTGKLERLWGAEYLRRHLPAEGSYRVPRFIIVIEDYVKQLPVHLHIGRLTNELSIHSFETDFGEILVERIDGVPVSGLHHKDALDHLGYDDYRDPGNIIQKDELFYIVDTEWKSLKGISTDPKEYRHLREFLKERFKAFYPRNRQTLNIRISPPVRSLSSRMTALD